MNFEPGYSISDIVNACLLAITLVTLFYTIFLNRKVLKLTFRPYVDVNPLPNQYGYEITHVDGLNITVYKNPIQVRFMKIYLTTWVNKKEINETKEIDGIDNEIVMPSENIPSSNYPFNYQYVEWLRESKKSIHKLTMSVLINYTLVGDTKTYYLQKSWVFKENTWTITKISAT